MAHMVARATGSDEGISSSRRSRLNNRAATQLSIHEAGHIVVARVFGIRVERFERDMNGEEAEVFFTQESPSEAVRHLEDVIIAKAGEFAERTTGHEPKAGDIAGDRQSGEVALRRLDGRDERTLIETRGALSAVCDAFLDRPDVKDAILRLAGFIDANPDAAADHINDFVNGLGL